MRNFSSIYLKERANKNVKKRIYSVPSVQGLRGDRKFMSRGTDNPDLRLQYEGKFSIAEQPRKVLHCGHLECLLMAHSEESMGAVLMLIYYFWSNTSNTHTSGWGCSFFSH